MDVQEDLARALSKDRMDGKVAIIEEGKSGFELSTHPDWLRDLVFATNQVGSPVEFCERRTRTKIISRMLPN